MTKAAFELFEETFRDEQNRYQARRIRNMVTQARQTIPSAGPRWPFELLQNALDAGPRVDSTTVAIRLNCEQAKVIFEHDGIPFTSSDLTALLSGGSNKDLESEETTGRFGTGFLVTHVLAERTTFRGLLEAPSGYGAIQPATGPRRRRRHYSSEHERLQRIHPVRDTGIGPAWC